MEEQGRKHTYARGSPMVCSQHVLAFIRTKPTSSIRHLNYNTYLSEQQVPWKTSPNICKTTLGESAPFLLFLPCLNCLLFLDQEPSSWTEASGVRAVHQGPVDVWEIRFLIHQCIAWPAVYTGTVSLFFTGLILFTAFLRACGTCLLDGSN